MKSSYSIFYRLNESKYWVQINNNFNPEYSNTNILFFEPPTRLNRPQAYLTNEKDINEIMLKETYKVGKYYLYVNNKIIAFKPVDDSSQEENLDYELQLFESRVLRIAEKFRRIMWYNLANKIYLINTEDALNILKRHTFSDHYSLWLYNKYTNYFSLHCASFHSQQSNINLKKDFMSKEEIENLISYDIEKQGSLLISTQTFIEKNIILETLEINWVNRLTIDTDTELTGIISFYSKHKNFPFSDKAKTIIPDIIKSKLIDEFSPYFKKNIDIKNLTDNYIPGNISNFLSDLLPSLLKIIDWEAASIFLIDRTKSKLVLNSAALNSQVKSQVSNIRRPEHTYDISKTSLTASVYNENKLHFSYDINSDNRNTHGYDEQTINPAKNWIGIPIKRTGERPIGVLRVVNKIKNKNIVTFNQFDIDILYNIASIIAYIYHIEEAFSAKKLQINKNLMEQEKENKKLNEYLKTFRHELKSPLTVITQASKTILRTLNNTGIINNDNIPKKVKDVLSDLDMVGSRLVYVINLLSFEASDLVKNINTCHLFKDVIAPVLAFSIQYSKNRNKTIKFEKDEFMHLVDCDPMAVSIAFHTLIDNAVKYSNKNSIIFVRCKTMNGICSISVTNNGIPILQDEQEDIFLRYFRGSHAKQQKTDGSGIGLYLAKEIMKLNNGNVILRRLAAPTEFELQIKQH